jgi:hypothetical protein
MAVMISTPVHGGGKLIAKSPDALRKSRANVPDVVQYTAIMRV